MKRNLFACLLILAVFSSSNALADEGGNIEADEAQRYPWSVGAGIGLSVYSQYPPMSSMMGSGGYAGVPTPFGVVLLEKQLSEHLALTFDVSGSYSNLDRDSESEKHSFYNNLNYMYSASASAGVRWIFNPNGAVEVSGLVLVSGSIDGNDGEYSKYIDDGESEGGYVTLDQESRSFYLGCDIGIAFERKLMDNLFLRFQTSVVKSHWGRHITDSELVDGTTDTNKSSIFNIGLSFVPAIQLRLEI